MFMPSTLAINQVDLDRLYTGSNSGLFVSQNRDEHYALRLDLYVNVLEKVPFNSEGLLDFSGESDCHLKIKDINGQIGAASALDGSVSSNGRYAAFAIENVGYFTLDLNQKIGKVISKSFRTTQDVWPKPIPSLAVSDDGSYIVVGGQNIDTKVYVVTGAKPCGTSISSDIIEKAQIDAMMECESRNIVEFTNSRAPHLSGHPQLIDVHMGPRGDSFSYFDGEKWATIYAPNYIAPDSMDYVALGDSFSSGEGDYFHPEGTHYLPNTNVLGNYKNGTPRELCHLSDRSYPFLLAKDMGVGRGPDMQSVACSGAVRFDVLDAAASSGVSDGYLGQITSLQDAVSAPRLRGMENAEQLKTDARANFIPGRVQQVEFIKKKHPKVATVGISGNDLGFSTILKACLLNAIGTCDYAKGEGLADLGRLIQGNYAKQVAFYHQLKQASPGTDFYA